MECGLFVSFYASREALERGYLPIQHGCLRTERLNMRHSRQMQLDTLLSVRISFVLSLKLVYALTIYCNTL